MKPRVRLENWWLLAGGFAGICYGHPKHLDGTLVYTSQIVDLDIIPSKGAEIETRNTVYLLGEPFPWPEELKRNSTTEENRE